MTTVTLRPNGDVQLGSTTITGAATAWQATSDNSDATYIDLSLFGVAYLSLTTSALPAGAVVRSAAVRFRALPIGGSGRPPVRTLLAKSNLAADPAGDWSTTVSYPSALDYSPGTVAVSLTQTEIDNLVFVMFNLSSTVSVRLFEVYADLVYATVPVVVTGTASSTATVSPTVSWAYTAGADGGPQVAYEMKVFASAVYGGGGFDPATSSAAFSTGVVASGAASAAVSGLLNSTTYKAYVRAAQLVNGAYQWSAWDDGAAWTTSFTAALVLSVTPTASNANGYISVAIARNTTAPNTAWQAVTLERSDDGGTTWEWVRGATAVSATNTFATWGASTVTVLDYEAGNGVTVTYRARAFTAASGDVWGPWVSSSTTSWSSSDVWLKDPHTPSNNTKLAAPRGLSGMQQTWTPYVHDIAGREKPIVVTSTVLRSINGGTTFLTETATAATEFARLIAAAPVVLLQLPSTDRWGSRYLGGIGITDNRAVEIIGHPGRLWDTSFVEVDQPEDETA